MQVVVDTAKDQLMLLELDSASGFSQLVVWLTYAGDRRRSQPSVKVSPLVVTLLAKHVWLSSLCSAIAESERTYTS